MANDEHVALLRQGVAAWNAWRDENRNVLHPDGVNLRGANLIRADLQMAHLGGANLIEANLNEANLGGAYLREANLSGANLSGADLRGANLFEAHLDGANLFEAHLDGAILSGAHLIEANLFGANLFEANLRGANLIRADLRGANLREANLSGANLTNAVLRGSDLRCSSLVGTNLADADLTGCRIYGIAAWSLTLERTKQQDLLITRHSVITRDNEPEITVDNIEVAQFIYLLLNNEKVRDVIDTVTSKAVLILGRFTAGERKSVLDAIRDELRRRGYLPILFDFDKPANRDITETISLLARMARFVVADITDAKAIPQELNVIVPDLPSVPVQPLLLKESGEYGMFEHYARYPWVLPLYQYETQDQLIAALGEKVIEPAERKALELHSGARPIPPII